jgi:hypothetical protein
MDELKKDITNTVVNSKPMFLIIVGVIVMILGGAGTIPIFTPPLVFNIYWQVGLTGIGLLLFFIGLWLLIREEVLYKGSNTMVLSGKNFSTPTRLTLVNERSFLTAKYYDLSKASSEIEAIGLTLKSFRDGFGVDKIVNFLEQGKKIKLLLLFPTAYVTQIRQLEEKTANFEADIKITIQFLEEIYSHWKKSKRREWDGSLEMRFYDTIPYSAYFRADNTIILGLYYRHKSGLQSECIEIQQNPRPGKKLSEEGISANLRNSFTKLWEENKDNTYCVIGPEKSFVNPRILANEAKLKKQLN